MALKSAAETPSAKSPSTTPAAISHIREIRSGPENKVVHYECLACGKKIKSRTQKYYHVGCGNEAAKKYKCQECDRTYSSRYHLNYHLDSAHSSSTYTCDICGTIFKNRFVLAKHSRQHSRQPLQCTECNKILRSQSSLNVHLEKHANILRHACPQCDKKYATKASLVQHQKSHQDKEFGCRICGKLFQRNTILTLHMKKHEDGSVACNKCDKWFSDANTLMRHAKLCHGYGNVRKYHCLQCNMSTLRKDNMLRHVRNMHAEVAFDDCVQVTSFAEPPTLANSEANEEDERQDVEMARPPPLPPPPMPKTVANSSVIKCIGNVEPVTVPFNSDVTDEEMETQDFAVAELTRDDLPQVDFENPKRPQKSTYDPIQMYRKILIGDDASDQEELATEEPNSKAKTWASLTTVDTKQMLGASSQQKKTTPSPAQQQRAGFNSSNFSETHWRKNFKYTYEYQEN